MSCADDPAALSDEVIATRAARLCRAGETAWRASGGEPPLYVVGTEVPTPGGAAEELDTLAVTTPAAVTATLGAHRAAFHSLGVEAAWERVIALVVQPGVEFDHHKVIDYQPAKARELSLRIEREPGLVYEAHSTDYQTRGRARRPGARSLRHFESGTGCHLCAARSAVGSGRHRARIGRRAGAASQASGAWRDAPRPAPLEIVLHECAERNIRSAIQPERPHPVLLDRAGSAGGMRCAAGELEVAGNSLDVAQPVSARCNTPRCAPARSPTIRARSCSMRSRRRSRLMRAPVVLRRARLRELWPR